MAQGPLPLLTHDPSILLILRITGNSSLHRLARVQQLPTPSTDKDALKILGDQEDHAWPGSSWGFWRRILGCFKGGSFGSRMEAIKELLECLKIYRHQESLAISKQKATYDLIQYFRRVLNQQTVYHMLYTGYMVHVQIPRTHRYYILYIQ